MLCECGCGGETAEATKTSKAQGYVKGQPFRFIRGHNSTVRRGERNPLYRGGTSRRNGYVRRLVQPGHLHFTMARPMNGSYYIPEHRLVMAESLSRSLTDVEVVHHRNHVRDDNRIENLQLFACEADHKAFHDGR